MILCFVQYHIYTTYQTLNLLPIVLLMELLKWSSKSMHGTQNRETNTHGALAYVQYYDRLVDELRRGADIQ
jgi:hypothetical protein